jgi:Zinc-binding domain of primase-helicase
MKARGNFRPSQAAQGNLNRPAAPPPDELGEPCPECGAKEKWRWLDGRSLCRACLISGDRRVTDATALEQDE